MTVSVAALALAAALGRLSLAGAGGERSAAASLGFAGVVVLAVALVRGGLLVAVALVALVAEFGVRTIAHAVSPAVAVAEAAGLLALAELADWALSLARGAEVETAAAARRAEWLAAAVAVAAAAALLTLLAASI